MRVAHALAGRRKGEKKKKEKEKSDLPMNASKGSWHAGCRNRRSQHTRSGTGHAHIHVHTERRTPQHYYVRRGARLLYLRRTTVTGITMSNGVVVGVPTRSIKVCGFPSAGLSVSILLRTSCPRYSNVQHNLNYTRRRERALT